jgi:hypothetical protein
MFWPFKSRTPAKPCFQIGQYKIDTRIDLRDDFEPLSNEVHWRVARPFVFMLWSFRTSIHRWVPHPRRRFWRQGGLTAES